MSRRNPTPESGVLKACRELLAYHRSPLNPLGILAFRMNSGAIATANGRPVRFGEKGMADLLSFPRQKLTNFEPVTLSDANTAQVAARLMATILPPRVLWIECKAPSESQTDAQREFQKLVEARGCTYLVIDNPDTLSRWLKENA